MNPFASSHQEHDQHSREHNVEGCHRVVLPAVIEEGEPLRELRFPDRPLRTLDVVTHTAEFEALVVNVPNSIAGQRTPVPWLADTAGVDKSRTFERELVDAILMRDLAVDEPE